MVSACRVLSFTRRKACLRAGTLTTIRVLVPATPESHQMLVAFNCILYRSLTVLGTLFCVVLLSLVTVLALMPSVEPRAVCVFLGAGLS